MKKIYLFFTAIFFLTAGTIQAQQVEREYVLLEIVTSTTCYYCPGAAMGADDLVDNGHDAAVINYHISDGYSNNYSNSRASYYQITGTPTAYFDGTIKISGGSNTESLYNDYLQMYNQRKPINSSFTLDVTGEMYGMNNYKATVDVEKVAGYSGTNLRLHLALTESNIQQSWQGQDHLNFVLRLMVPDQYGTSLDFSGGDTQTVELEFSLDQSWVRENMEVVAFVQDNSTKEVLQATKLDLTTFEAAYDFNAEVYSIRNIPDENCSETLYPVVKIYNVGDSNLTQLDFEYNVNGGEPASYQWTGELGFLEFAEVELDEIEFMLDEENTLTVFGYDPNGHADEYPGNDTTHDTFTGAEEVPQTVKLLLKLDNNPEETSWDVRNAGNEIIYSGGDYTDPGQMISQTFEFDEVGCYTFNIYDEGGNGLQSGYFILYHGSNNVILEGTKFGEQAAIQFGAGGFVGVEENAFDPAIAVYPVPANEQAITEFNIEGNSQVEIDVYDLMGKRVYQSGSLQMKSGIHQMEINTSDLNNGVYFVKLRINNQYFTKKISVNR
ncbi:MAG: Omp28-related outer membrane protein [Bacteroidales bacterium]|nr:Omp28-related outer membrane protein [Bacteroidales bacterium]MCF8344074.1 Omp28-related outer membrane protein [Bacteroidales bacterium]MCF8349734.1 Omp28-related outer membrane protein [Bacteroidales bacterium]MCF8376665.1 Omp28-related outer membrane protein [Bacteroidales bacterium]MCF8402041.1 Omp28-related outer membrane protein [Bacteroidales bacterium]